MTKIADMEPCIDEDHFIYFANYSANEVLKSPEKILVGRKKCSPAFFCGFYLLLGVFFAVTQTCLSLSNERLHFLAPTVEYLPIVIVQDRMGPFGITD